MRSIKWSICTNILSRRDTKIESLQASLFTQDLSVENWTDNEAFKKLAAALHKHS